MTGANLLTASQHTRSFPLDEDVLSGTHFKNPNPWLNHGRNIVRNRAGCWITCFTTDLQHAGTNWLVLCVGDAAAAQGSDFPGPLCLLGPSHQWVKSLLTHHGPKIGQSCALLDANDRLHVFFDTDAGLHHLSADASGDRPHQQLAAPASWSAVHTLAGPGSRIGDALLHTDGRTRLYYTLNNALYRLAPDQPPTHLADDATHPSVHIDDAGVEHLAFERDRRIFYMRNAGEPAMVAHFCSSWPSIAATPDGRVVIAWQGEGKADLKRYPQLYSALCDAAGSTISYAVQDGTRWTLHDLLRSSQIVLKRRPHHRNPQIDPRFTAVMEEFWRPSLALDRHGCLWMFFVNTTRRHVYWSRFQGQTFGEHHEARGAYDCLSRSIWVMKDARRSDAVGFMTAAANQMYFDSISTPAPAAKSPHRITMIDLLEAEQVIGLEHELGQWRKHPDPVFGWQITGDQPEDHIAWAQVEPAAGGFLMHYFSMESDLRSNALPGRAFSADGIRWEKRTPALTPDWTLDGAPMPNTFWRPLFLIDPDEPDPSQRFKGLYADWQPVDRIEHRIYRVVVSADGRHWRSRLDLDPIVQGDISVPRHLLRDDHDVDPRRRYKFITCHGSHAGRGVVSWTSPDLLHWSRIVYLRENTDELRSAVSPHATGPLPLDPDGGEHPWEEEIHDAYQWRENGLLMFHYDSFYFGANQHVEKALAVSRDGKHYWRIRRGRINLPHGPCGAWDSGRVRTSVPIRVGNELWLYYCGMPASYFDNPDDPNYKPPLWADAWSVNSKDWALKLRPWRVGLAKLRVDGWAYLQLAREASQGRMITIPFQYPGGPLRVNGIGLGAGLSVGWIRDGETEPLTGFTTRDCRFSSADAVDSTATWTGGSAPTPGRYRLIFDFTDLRAKLFAWGLTD